MSFAGVTEIRICHNRAECKEPEHANLDPSTCTAPSTSYFEESCHPTAIIAKEKSHVVDRLQLARCFAAKGYNSALSSHRYSVFQLQAFDSQTAAAAVHSAESQPACSKGHFAMPKSADLRRGWNHTRSFSAVYHCSDYQDRGRLLV